MRKKKYDDHINYLKKYGTNPLSYLTLSENLSKFTGDWEGYIAYKSFLKTVVILGDPIVSNKNIGKCINDLKKKFISNKHQICFFLCKKKLEIPLRDEGFKGFCFGQDAIVNLEKFNISGKKKASIRSSINYAKRQNMIVEEYNYNLKKSKKIENEIKKISKEWLKTKKEPELTFAVGNIDFGKNKETRYFIAKYQDRIHGFLTYIPIYGGKGYYLDLTRRKKNSLRGTIDYLMVESFKILKKEGVKKIYIGGAPLYFKQLEPKINILFTTLFFKICKPFFGFIYPQKSELFFKKKYATEWEPYYIFYYPRFNLRIFLSTINSIYEGGIASIIIHKIKCLRK